jgi:hypothetical protein
VKQLLRIRVIKIARVFGPVRCLHNPLESLDGYNLEYYKLYCSNKDELIKKHRRSIKLKLLKDF